MEALGPGTFVIELGSSVQIRLIHFRPRRIRGGDISINSICTVIDFHLHRSVIAPKIELCGHIRHHFVQECYVLCFLVILVDHRNEEWWLRALGVVYAATVRNEATTEKQRWVGENGKRGHGVKLVTGSVDARNCG